MDADINAKIRMLGQLPWILIARWFPSGLAGFPRFRVSFAGRPQQARFRRGIDELRQRNVTIFVRSRCSGDGRVPAKLRETGKYGKRGRMPWGWHGL